MVSQYHMYVIYVIALIVPADHYFIVSHSWPVPLVYYIGRVLIVITYVVLANNTIFGLVSRNHLHMVNLITMPYIPYQLPIQNFMQYIKS